MTLDPDPLRPDDIPEPDDNPPAVIAWGCFAGIAFVVIVGVLLLIAFRQPVAGSVTESRVASVAVGPSDGRLVTLGSAPVPITQREGLQPSIRQRISWTPIRRVAGQASWYCQAGVSACHNAYPDRPGKADYYAAAGPRVRRMFGGDWRGRNVIVSAGGRSVVVKLVDWCACPSRVLDLYADAFERLAPLSVGVVDVRVSSRTSAIGKPLSRDKPSPTGPLPTAPATDYVP